MGNVQEIDRAVRLHHAGRLDAAATLYRQILAGQPDHLGALNGLGMIEFQSRRFAAAIDLLERVVAVAGEHAGFLMNLGAVHDGAGNRRQAERCYTRAIAAAPGYPDPYYNLGALHLRCGRAKAAIEVFDQCMAAIGREFHALAYKAHALRDAGRSEEARYLLDHDRYVGIFDFAPPPGYPDLATFDSALADFVQRHPTLRANVMSTVNGRHTGELLGERTGPMAAMTPLIHQAVECYRAGLPVDPAHPVVKWAPRRWKLVYQSRSGRPSQPWLEPDICDYLKAISDLLTSIFSFVELKRMDTLEPGLELSFLCQAETVEQLADVKDRLLNLAPGTRLSIIDQPELMV